MMSFAQASASGRSGFDRSFAGGDFRALGREQAIRPGMYRQPVLRQRGSETGFALAACGMFRQAAHIGDPPATLRSQLSANERAMPASLSLETLSTASVGPCRLMSTIGTPAF